MGMKIGLIGGTGDIGEGLAVRWGLETGHEILVGSRSAEKASARAAAFLGKIEAAGKKGRASIVGVTNEDAAKQAEIVVLCVEAATVAATLRDLRGHLNPEKIVVTPAVSMARKGGFFHYTPPAEGSMAAHLAGILGEEIPLVSAFHTVPAHKLSTPGAGIDQDVVVLGDHPEAKKTIMSLAAEIPGLKPIDGGALVTSSLVESITPLLINLAIVNKRKNIAIKFV